MEATVDPEVKMNGTIYYYFGDHKHESEEEAARAKEADRLAARPKLTEQNWRDAVNNICEIEDTERQRENRPYISKPTGQLQNEIV